MRFLSFSLSLLAALTTNAIAAPALEARQTSYAGYMFAYVCYALVLILTSLNDWL